jgi:threonine/homoserine/homoserine lactone efflux protein
MLPTLAFLLAATLLAITPGPGITYVVARTVAGGRLEGVVSCFGTALGGMLHVVAAACGLSLLLVQSALAFTVVKYLGAAYLIYLGLKLLLSRAPAQKLPAVSRRGVCSALRDGIVVEALNIKTAMFFLAFIPQFVDPAKPVASQFVVLGTICIALNTLADLVAVLLASRLLESDAGRAARARWLTRASGITMLGLGAYVALAKRPA